MDDAQRNTKWRFAFLGVVLSTVTFLACDSSAMADNATQPDALDDYYESEVTVGHAFVAVGVLSAGIGGLLLSRRSTFERATGWPVLAFAAIGIFGGGAYAQQMGADHQTYSEELRTAPSTYRDKERLHAGGIRQRYLIYRIAEASLALIGVGMFTYGTLKSENTVRGIGLGLAIEAATFFSIDSFGAAHTSTYLEHVEAFTPTISLQLGVHNQWGLVMGSSF